MPASPSPSDRWPWVMLAARSVLFVLFQALFAGGYALSGGGAPWNRSAAWWPVAVPLTNLVCLFLLARLYRQEGSSYWDIFRIDRARIKADLLAMLGMLVISGPVALLPNSLLASALFGDPMTPMRLFLAPLPALGIASALVLFPITQGLAELPCYFNYVMPRLEKQVNPWLAYVLASLFLGFQHAAMPLRFEGRFFLWRLLMFVPFAFLVGALLKWRPRLLPYMAAVHALMDFATAVMYLMPF